MSTKALELLKSTKTGPGFTEGLDSYENLVSYYETLGAGKHLLEEEISARGLKPNDLTATDLDLLADQADEYFLNKTI